MPVDQDAFKGTHFDAVNRELADRTVEALSKIFPMKTEDGKLEVHATNVKIDTSKHDPYDLNAWQTAREQGGMVSAPVTADLALYRDGKRIQTRSKAKVGDLPLMGSSGTFMVGGNDWFTPFAQFRLKPGIYSKQKTNGEYESFMPMQGASMTVWMDPAKGIFKLSHGSTNVALYPVLKALGKTDEQIVQAWGGDQRARELLEQNKVDKGEKDIDKLFESVFHLKQNRDLLKGGVIKLNEELTGVDYAGKVTALKTWMDSKWLDPYVTKKTVGTAIDKPNDTAFLLASRKILDVQRGDVDPDDRDSPHYKTSHNVADLMAERIERNAWRMQKKLVQRLRKGPDVTLGEAMGPGFLDPLTTGFFGGAGGIEGGMAHTAEGANPLALASELSKTTFMGPGGIADMHAVTKESRLFRPGSLGFVDSVHSPEGCFGPASEVYTSTGWVRWDAVTADMELACQVDGRLEYHKPLHIVTAPYAGPMVGFKSARVEFFVTPNHRMWVRPLFPGSTYRIVEAGTLRGLNRNVMSGGHAPLPGLPEPFDLPRVVAAGTERQKPGMPPIGSFLKNTKEPINIVAWCRFLGWYLSEGNTYTKAELGRYVTTITQLHRSTAECAHIAKTLDALLFKWAKGGDRRFRIQSKQLTVYLRELGKSRSKYVPPEVFTAPPDARLAFLEAAFMGDGRKRTIGKGERGNNPLARWECYCTTSKRLADDIYRLMFELGLSGSITFEPDERKPIYLGCYCVHVHSFNERQLTSKNHRHPEGQYYTADYAGMTYCATVPGGLMFCRHGDGMGFWIGNSAVGLNTHAASTARKIGKSVAAQFVPVLNGRAQWNQRVGLTVEEANDTTIGYPEFWDPATGTPIDPYDGTKNPETVRANRDNEILEVPPGEVKYILPNGLAAFDFVGNAAGFFANTHPNRGMMAGKHITQALPLIHREVPLTTLKTDSGKDVMTSLGKGSTVNARNAGTVTKIEETGIWVDGVKHAIFDRYPMQAKVAIDHIPVVKVGDVVEKGDLLADSNYTKDGQLALGVNLRSAYIPWKNASNYEDAYVISEAAAKKLTSDHTHRHELLLEEGTKVDATMFIAQFPTLLTREMVSKLGTDGVIREGQEVKPGDVLIAAIRPRKYDEFDRTAKNLSSIHKMLERPWLDASVKWDEDFVGTVNRVVRSKDKIEVHVQTAEAMRVGDKISMGSAAKGTISAILPDHEMPTDEKGQSIEVICNPHGVAGRINPSQTLEQAVGKLVRDHGVKFDHVNFGDNKVAERVQGLLDEHKVKHEERLFDPVEGRFIENPVPVGYNYIYKLDHPVRKKFSARTRDGYTMDESPTSGRGKGAQSFDQLTSFALLGHDAHAILGESMGVRGTKNDDYWVAYQAGEKPPAPKVPFVFEKLRAMMAASGIDSQQHGNALHFMPMTDANTLKRSNGEITKARLIRAKDLAEESQGLFDVGITGGLKGSRWSHIDLGRKIPHPLYEKVIKDLLDLKTADYLGVIGQTRHYHADTGEFSDQPGSNTTTGEAAFRQMMDFDPIERLKEVQKKARTASGSDLNRLNRAARYLKGLQDVRQKPFDAYMVSKVPVIPPMYRPVIEQRNGGLRVADANLLYRDMILTRDTLQKGEQEGSLSSQDLAKARVSLYDAFGAMVGVGKSLTHRRDADLRGFVDVIKGKNNKEGLFQQQLARRRNDYTGRSTIEPDATLSPDEIAIPEEMAWKIYLPAIVRRLAQLGWKPADALREVERKGLVARNALDEELRTRPVIYNRAPSLHRWSVLAAMPKLTSGKEIKISPFVEGALGSDHDGDTVSIFAPLSDAGKREAHDLLPSRNLWYDKDRSLAFAVDKDVITGLFALTRVGINSGKNYPTRQLALDAYKNNKDGLRMDSLVRIDDEKTQNLQAIGWMIFEGLVPARFLGGISPPIDGKKLTTLLTRIATDSPADFATLGRALQSAGFTYAARAGGIGGTVKELAIDRTKINALLNQISRATRQGQTMEEKRKLALETYAKVKPELDKIIVDHLDTVGLGGSVFLAAKPSSKLGIDSYRQMVVSPVMVKDARDRAIPSVIKSSYGGGMLLSDYIMATPGARSGMVDKGLSVAGPGFLTKLLAGNLGPVRIETKDCGTLEGLQVPVEPPEGVKQHDVDLLDRHLLHDIAGTRFKRNDVVTPTMLATLRDAKVRDIMVRSPLTCDASSPPCQMCAGRTPDGKVHPVGANIGYNYGQTIGERSTQLTLRCSSGLVWANGQLLSFQEAYERHAPGGKDGTPEDLQTKHAGGSCLVENIERHAPTDSLMFISFKSGATLVTQANHPLVVKKDPVHTPKLKLQPNACFRLVGNQHYRHKQGDRPDQIGSREARSIKLAGRITKDDAVWVDYRDVLGFGSVTPDVPGYLIGSWMGDAHLHRATGSCKPGANPDFGVTLTSKSGARGQDPIKTKQLQVLTGAFSPTTIKTTPIRIVVRGPAPVSMWYAYVGGTNNNEESPRPANRKYLRGDLNMYSEHWLREFLAGMIDTDGCVHHQCGSTVVSICTTSYELCSQLQIIARKFGFTCNTSIEDRATRPSNHRTAFVLHFRFHSDPRLPSVKFQTHELKLTPREYDNPILGWDPVSNVRILHNWQSRVYDVKTETGTYMLGVVENHNSFHSGGTVGSAPSLADGFARLNELLAVPETVKGQGTLADVTGSVTSIKAAPQGGHYIQILPEGQSSLRGDHVEHYVLPGRNIAVVQGESVKRGDRLSDGSYRPQEIAEKQGLLAAQTYVVDEMRKAFQSAGAVVRKPVLEVAVAAMMRFMRITNDGGEKDLMTGQIMSEQAFKMRKLQNPKVEGVPELPGLSHVPLVRSTDMLERLNFQRLEDTLREIPAQGGVSDLSGAKSPIPGFAYGAAFRPGQASFELTKDRIPYGDSAFNRLSHM